MPQPLTNDLNLPIQSGGFSSDPAIDDALARQFRAIEAWANGPHRTYGTHSVSPLYYGELDDIAGTTQLESSQGTPTTFGAAFWIGITLELDRRSKVFMWGHAEIANSSATNYRCEFYLPVSYGGNTYTGRAMRERMLSATSVDTKIFSNMRSHYIDVSEKTTVEFGWAFMTSSALPKDGWIERRRLIVAVFDAPDMDANVPVAWTTSAINQAAYRTEETNDFTFTP